MIESLLHDLADAIIADFRGKTAGHCVRVDDLSREEGAILCSWIRGHGGGFDCFVAALGPTGLSQIRLDQAVELRDRKDQPLCLIVPSELRDLVPESLENAFARFDVRAFLDRKREQLITKLPPNLRDVARRLKSLLRSRAAVSTEAFIEYLLQLSDDPTPESAGRELWRVGLVPDLDPGFASRLPENRQAVEAIARPLRPQSPPRERLLRAGLAPGGFTNRLARYLADRPLHQTEAWQEPIARDARFAEFSFDRWEFPPRARSDLSVIVVQPFVDEHGTVQTYCHLDQDAPGQQLKAPLGARSKVTVRWTSEPATPKGVASWRVAMIPSRDEYTDDVPADLPVRVRKAGATAQKSANLPLDFDAEEAGVRAVQIKVTALDERGGEVCGKDGSVIESVSGEFWLTSDPGPADGDGERKRVRSEVSLAVARIETTLNLPDESPGIQESAPGWDTKDFYYFHVCLNGREEKRIIASRALAELQDRMLCHPRSAWYSADVEPDTGVQARDIQPDPLPEEFANAPAWADFFKKRKALFETLRVRETRSRVESLEWDDSLADEVRRYARSYRELLEALSENGQAESLRWALRTDTLAIRVVFPGGRDLKATVILPLQPLRLLWYAGYALLLESWRQKLGELPSRSKRGSVELEFVRALSPQNLPAFIPGDDDGVHLFCRNLGLFLGIALPVDVQEPGRAVATLASFLGLPAELSGHSDLTPQRMSRAVSQYLELHPDRRALRIGVANPGDATGLAEAISHSLADSRQADTESPVGELDLIAHCAPPLPIGLPGLDRLRDTLYLAERGGQTTHLHPRCQFALRKLEDLARLPGGDLHLTLLFDWSKPKFELASVLEGENGSSLLGLITRLCSRFESSDSHARWVHQLVLPHDSPRDRHPTIPGLSTELLDGQRAYLRAIGKLCDPALDQDHALSLVVSLDHEQRNRLDQIHYRSDWVLLIDRFLGVEVFDAPRDPYLAQVSRKYLLDYAPEFQEGLGHRMVITTAWREEVQHLLGDGLRELGFDAVTESVGEALDHLKSVSGGLALRLARQTSRAIEAVALAVTVAWMKSHGDLLNSILIPVDAHLELFDSGERQKQSESPVERAGQPGGALRCDLIQVRVTPRKLEASFIEVKSRSNTGHLTEVLDRMCDQLQASEDRFRTLFFDSENRLDHVLQRSRLAVLLRFYAQRAWRYGFFESEEKFRETLGRLDSLESGLSLLQAAQRGYVVNLAGKRQAAISHRCAQIRILTAADFEEHTSFRPVGPPPAHGTAPKASEGPASSIQATPTLPEEERPEPALDTAESLGKNEQHGGAAPAEADVTVPLGRSQGAEVLWKCSVVGSPHVFILGIPGQGKSVAVNRLVCQAASQGLPSLIIDFHGQFSAPDSIYRRTVQPRVWDAADGLPFTPFEASRSQGDTASFWKTNSFAVAEIFQYIFELGDIQRGLIYEAMRECYRSAGFESDEESPLPTMDDLERQIQRHEKREGVKNVLVRCKPVFDFRIFKETTRTGAWELLQACQPGLVVDLRKQQLEHVQIAAAAFLLRKVYKDMFRWGETERPRLLIALDEAHRVARDTTLPRIMKEGRKFGVVVISASQNLTDFHPEVLGNAGTKIVFRTNYPASKKVAGFLRGRKGPDMPGIVEQLPVGVAMVQTLEMPYAERVQMYQFDPE